MSKHKAIHRKTHTFAKAYHNARIALRGVEADPASVMDRQNLAHFKSLCIKWARSEKELAKAIALALPVA
jgi:hypothetical protein